MRTCTIAKLNIRNPQKLGWTGTLDVARWLERRAEDLLREDLSEAGFVGRYIDGVPETKAKLVVGAAGSLSPETRRRIAKWLRSRADYLRKHANVAMLGPGGWFTQEFGL
jgi:hypothetical protein